MAKPQPLVFLPPTLLGTKFEIKNSDILLAVVPIAFWFVLTGKVSSLEFGDFKIEAAFVEAAEASVRSQVTAIELPRLNPRGPNPRAAPT